MTRDAAGSADSSAMPAEQRAGGRSSFRQGISFNALSFLAMAVLGVGSSIATARVYGVDVIGRFALVAAPAEALWFLSSVKEQAALIRELTTLPPRAPRATGLWLAVFTFSSALTATVALLVGIGVVILYDGPVNHPELILPAVVSLGAYTAITNIGWNFDGLFAAFLAGRLLFWVRLHQALAFLVLGVVFGLVWGTVWGLVVATYGSAATALVHRLVVARRFICWRVGWRVVRDGFSALPGLLSFGIRIAPGTIFQGITQQSATWTLGIVGSVPNLGAFNRAQVLTRRFQDLNTKIVEMLFPTLVARHSAGDRAGYDRVLVDTLRYSTLFMLLVGAVGAGAAQGVLGLLGPGFTRAADAFGLLLLMPCLTTMSIIQANGLYAVNRTTITSVTAGVRMVITVAATILLTPALGLIGPALALVLGSLVDVVWKNTLLRAYLSRPVTSLWSWRQVAALLGACGAGWLAARVVDDALAFTLGVVPALAAGAAAYALAFLALGGINDRDRQRIGLVVRSLRRRAPALIPGV